MLDSDIIVCFIRKHDASIGLVFNLVVLADILLSETQRTVRYCVQSRLHTNKCQFSFLTCRTRILRMIAREWRVIHLLNMVQAYNREKLQLSFCVGLHIQTYLKGEKEQPGPII